MILNNLDSFCDVMFLTRLLSVLLTFVSLTSYANDLPKDVNTYYSDSEITLLLCKSTFKLVSVGGKGDYRSCIKEGKITLKKSYKKAAAAVNNQTAKNELKKHYIKLMSALEGIIPGIEERIYAYEIRQQQLKQALIEAWESFAIEM